jgi:hypothetical protein
MRTHSQRRNRFHAPLWSVLAALLLCSGTEAKTKDVDLNLVGASSVSRSLGAADTVPPSYFLGQARAVFGHAVGVSGFQQIASYRDVYPGINMACYGDEHHFEFAFILATGADPSQIRLQLNDVKTEGVSSNGDIVYTGDGFEAYQHAPAIFRHTDDGQRSAPGRLVVGSDGASSLAMAGYSDEHREALNNTRLSIVSAEGGSFGPDYDFFMSKFETTNEQLIRFLNDAQANQGNARGENMFFDDKGSVWINEEMQPGRDEMFQIDKTKIKYDPERVAGDRYHHIMDSRGREPYADHPATGVSWFGAVKYCNWLTLQSGRGPNEVCYHEGTNTLDWAPVTATNWANGFFTAGEREQWLKFKGFRLPMFRLHDPGDSRDNDAFNEFVKAGGWMGNTNVLYGYGRNSFTNEDANVLNTSMELGADTLPVGYFNGLNPLLDARTHLNENYFGIFDLSGNVAEWVNDPARAGTPDARSVCGGSYGDRIQPLATDRIVPPHACEAFGGFRAITTYMPQEYTQVNILYCFHSPNGIPEEFRERFGTQFDTMRSEKAQPADLLQPGEAPTAAGTPGEDADESADEGSDESTDEGAEEDLPDRLDDTADVDDGGMDTRPPGIIYKDDDDGDEASDESGDQPDLPGPGPGPGPPPPPPPPPPPETYQLGVYSENPDGGVNMAVSTTDVQGNSDGATGFGRYYYYNTQVTVTAPASVGDNTFKWWLRNGVPFSTANSVTVQMLSDLDLTAVYESPVPLIQRTLTVNSPAGNVPVKISLEDNNGQQNGGTTFSRVYDNGDTVTATAPPTFGAENFQRWLRNGVPFSNNESVTVTMNSDVTLTALYGLDPLPTDRQLIVASQNPDSGVPIDVSIPDRHGREDGDTTFDRLYEYGTPVTLTAPTTIGDKTFSHWLRNGARVSDNPSVDVTMLTDVVMTAVYVDPPDDIILTVHSDPQSGVPISIGTPDKDGAADGNTSFTRRYDRGAVTTVTAPPDINGGTLLFKNWVMNGIPLSTNTSINVSLLTDTELVAVYRPEVLTQNYTLTVQSQDPDNGVVILVSTPDINSNTDGSTTFNRTYEEGTETVLTAPEVAPNGNVFDYWIVDGVRYSNNRTINVAMYDHRTVTAVYKDDPLIRHVLTVESRNPNSSVVVTIDNPDVNNQQNGSTTFTRLYEDAEVVTLTARNPAFPGTSNTLKQWLLDGTPISTNATITVTMLRDITVTALYGPDIPATNHILTVESVNPGSGVDIQISQTDRNGDGDGSTDFQRDYDYGTPVTATAPEFAPNGNQFQHWLINGQIYSKNLSIDLTILGDVTITAVYDTYLTHTLTVDSRNPGSGIDVNVSNSDINNNQDGTTHFERIYEDGESVTLVAPDVAPNGRDVFKGWERNGSIITTNTSVNFTMYSDVGVTAVYGSPNTFDLVVKSENPIDDVNVSISTPDIRGDTDGVTTFTRTYNPGEGVTVTAEETTSEGTVFQEWLLNGQPYSQDRSINLTMLSDVELTAVYGPADPDNRWLVVRSANPDGGVTIGIDPEDQRHLTDGETAFVRLYQDGDVVTVDAPPSAGGNDFQQWILNGSPFSTNLTTTVTMYQDHEMIAVYGPPIEPEDRTLVVDSRNPNSGVPITVSQPDKSGNSDGDTVFVRIYPVGATTILTAPEQGGTNDTYFLHWELNGAHFSDDRTVTIEMLTDQHLTAVYGDVAQDVTLTVNARDADNDVPIVDVVVSVAPVDLNGDSGGETEFQRVYENGQTATLTAPGTAGGLPFKWWERDGTPTDTNQTVSIELLTDVTMTAVYGEPEPAGEVTLTVTSEGPDGGLVTFVTASPDNNANAGGSTTFDRVYNSGTEVTLTAPSASNGYVFDHWEIDGGFAGNDQTLTLALLSHVTATAVYKEPPDSQTGL